MEPLTTKIDTDALYVRWVEGEFGYTDVEKVTLDIDYDMGFCPTCGPSPPWIDVTIFFKNKKKKPKHEEAEYVTDLINSILKYAKE